MTVGIALVFGLIFAAGVLFATEWVPPEITALGIAVALALLEPWTLVTPAEAISGFASPATVAVLAMFILSEGVRRTGVVRRLGRRLARLTLGSRTRQLAVTLGLGGPLAGVVNNTPLVGVLIPLVVDLARRSRTSPSRLLLPLSYVSMLGGMLTLLGTSTTLLASDLSRRFLDHPMGLFELTPLGLLVLAVGALYLATVGRRLVPERIRPEEDLIGKFRLGATLHRARVQEGSSLVGRTLKEGQRGEDWDLDVLQIVRRRAVYLGPTTDQSVQEGDLLTLRADAGVAEAFAREKGLRLLPRHRFTDGTFVEGGHTIVEVTVTPDSDLRGKSVVASDFRNRYHGTVLAVRRGDRVLPERVETRELREGDSLLVLMQLGKRSALEAMPGVVVTRVTPMEEALREPSAEEEAARRRTPLALGIVAAVVVVAALGVVPIAITALGGVVLMVATGCLRTSQAYEAVGWSVIFLLAGLIPLGIAMERTGAARLLADLLLGSVAGSGGSRGAILVLAAFYLGTALLTNLISNNASVVLMIPVAIDAAERLGAAPFPFVVAVTFAASTAFLTPVGYQTNLMVYGPGGYRFTDYARVGGPLQLLLAVVTPLGIALIWGV
jgi:di/tricarboxylate transporter